MKGDGDAHGDHLRAAQRSPFRLAPPRQPARGSIIADPETAANAAAEAKRRAEEARAAWESANLPPDLAALRAAQRLASTTQDVTVIVAP